MGMFDKQLMFSEAQTLIQGGAATVASTNVIDLGASGVTGTGATVAGNVTYGRDVELVVRIVQAVAGSTVNFRLIQSAESDLSSPTTLYETGAIAAATLVAGYRPNLGQGLPNATQRYLAIHYITGGAVTAGSVTSGLTLDRQSGY